MTLIRTTCACPKVVGPDGNPGEYCDACHQPIQLVIEDEPQTDRERLLEAERLVREVLDNQPHNWDQTPIRGRLGYVADTLIDLMKEVV